MRKTLAIAIAALLTGCAATGPAYKDVAEKMEPVRSDKARVTVFRTTKGFSYAIRSASVRLDNRPMPSVPAGSFFISEVESGRHNIAVDLWDVPGKCELSFDATQGDEIFMEVRPTQAVPAGLIPALLFSAIDSADFSCPGAFSIRKVEREDASQKLTELQQAQ